MDNLNQYSFSITITNLFQNVVGDQQQLYDVMRFIQEYSIFQIVCLSGQAIITVVSIAFICENLNGYPIKQNTNSLTVLLLISFFGCNILIVLVNKVVIGTDQFLNPQNVCFWKDSTVQILSYFYTFLSQLTIPAICLKLFRVSVAYYQPLMNRKWIVAWMKNKNYIILTVFAWSFIWTTFQLIVNQVIDREKDFEIYGGLQLYQYFCQKLPSNDPNKVWLFQLTKFLITTVLYLIQYAFANKINSDYRFKSQYNSQALILLTAIVSRAILDLYGINNMIPWYYYTIFMYYISTVTIAYYHRMSSNNVRSFYPNQLDFSDPIQKMKIFKGFKQWFYKFQKSINRQNFIQFSQKIIPYLDQLKLNLNQLIESSSQQYKKQQQYIDQMKPILNFIGKYKKMYSHELQQERERILADLSNLKMRFQSIHNSQDIEQIAMQRRVSQQNRASRKKKRRISQIFRASQNNQKRLLQIFHITIPNLVNKIYYEQILNWKRYKNYEYYLQQRTDQQKLIQNLLQLNIALGPNQENQ